MNAASRKISYGIASGPEPKAGYEDRYLNIAILNRRIASSIRE